MSEYNTIKQAIDEFHEASFVKHGSYAFSAGFLGSLLADMMVEPAPYHAEVMLNNIRRETAHIVKYNEEKAKQK